MQTEELPRILIAAPSSGGGKTTITCAMMQALCNRGIKVQAFKSGPDYIDPMFHRKAIGVPSCNLDLFLSSEETVKMLLAEHAAGKDIAIIEGAMGYYDGVSSTTRSSSYHLSAVTQTPTILVLDGKGMMTSAAAIVKGFQTFRDDNCISGIILNRVSAMTYPKMKEIIERECKIPVLGFLPLMEDIAFHSRHLGLVTADEIMDIQSKLQRLAEQVEKTVDIEQVITIAKSAPKLEYKALHIPRGQGSPVKIGIAYDKAFCFYYEDNLKLLEKLGAELTYFSPLEDLDIPKDIDGLIFGGGYPELYAPALSQNKAMRDAVKTCIKKGMPYIAECGGFQYIQKSIQDKENHQYSMCGVLDSESYPTGKLCRFGYIEMTAKRDNILCESGERIPAHEFHYWDSTETGDTFTAKKPGQEKHWECGIADATSYAGYPHLYFYSDIRIAERFLSKCRDYHRRREGYKDEYNR